LVPQSQTSPTGIYNEVDPMNFGDRGGALPLATRG
jgi:hypothetical protein